jgi:hypothetical protein
MIRTVDVGGDLNIYRSGGGDIGSAVWYLGKETPLKSRDDVHDMFLVLGNSNTCRKEKFQASIQTESSARGDISPPHVLFGPEKLHQDRLHNFCSHAASFACFETWIAEASSIVNTLFFDQSRFPWQFREGF